MILKFPEKELFIKGEYKKIIENYKDSPLFEEAFIRHLEKISDSDSFFEALEKKHKKFSTKREIRILYLKAKFYRKIGNYKKSKEIEKSIIKKYSKSPEALEIALKREKPILDIIRVLYAQEKWKEMIKKTKNKKIRNPELNYLIGYAYYKLKNYKKAIEFFKSSLLGGYEKKDLVNFYKGISFLYQGDTLRAIKSFSRNTNANSHFLEPSLRELRLIYLKSNTFKEKIEKIFDKLNVLNEEIIYFYYDKGDYKRVIKLLDAVEKKELKAMYLEYTIKRDEKILEEIKREHPLSFFYLQHKSPCISPDSSIKAILRDSSSKPLYDTIKLLLELNLIDDIEEKIKSIEKKENFLYLSKFFFENKNFYLSTILARKYYYFLRERGDTCFDEEFLKILFPTPYEDIVLKLSEKYGLDPALLYALMRRESIFDSLAISPRGAKGIMQIIEETAKKVKEGEFNLFKLEDNIEIGSKILKSLIDTFGLYFGICAYNAGNEAVKNWIEFLPKDNISIFYNIPYKETRNYLFNVLSDYLVYKFLYPNLKLKI
ncbi:MAG: transglycosylase SLT domain-containing protein [Candidatus Hydrothermales bacterium]